LLLRKFKIGTCKKNLKKFVFETPGNPIGALTETRFSQNYRKFLKVIRLVKQTKKTIFKNSKKQEKTKGTLKS